MRSLNDGELAPQARASGPHGRTAGCDVCIVTYNSAGTIRELLDSLDQSGGVQRVLVLDNASSDASVQVAEDFAKTASVPVELVVSPVNLGFPAGCNRLLARRRAPFAALVNPDLVLPPGVLPALVAAVGEDRTIGLATCQLQTSDGRPQREPARPRPRLGNVAVRSVASCLPEGVQAVLGRIARGARRRRLGEDRDVDATMGALMVFRSALVDEIGYLDESLFMDLEDLDLSERVRRRGLRIRYCGSLAAGHASGASRIGTDFEVERLRPALWITYFKRYGGRSERLGARAVIFVALLLRALVLGVRRAGALPELQAAREALTFEPRLTPTWSVPHAERH